MTVIETDGLTKQYGSGADAVVAVESLDLQVEAGEVFGFLGPNGAGKSTTINMLLDYIRPSDGNATVLGLDVNDDSERLRKRIGVLPEGLGLYDRLTGRRHLEFAVEWKEADDDVDQVLDRVGLDASASTRKVGGYSKGMQQRLAMAMALVGDPELLILDEPSSGLDPNGIRRLRDIVREEAAEGTSVFFSSHILGQVEAVSDRVGILSGGDLVAVDAIEELRATVGAGSELRLRVTDDIGLDVAGIDGVDAVSRADGILRVTCSDPRAKARVVSRLTDANVDVLDIDSEGATLDDVFQAYTSSRASSEPHQDGSAIKEVPA